MRKDYERLKEHILELLPGRRELRLNKRAKLVGVGGTVRALARYHLDRSRYPFEKLHNYRMDYDEVAWITSQFFRMKRQEMKSLQSMGQARAETMAAGSCVIRLLMKNLGVNELVTSTHGLREGTLALFLHDHRWFTARSFEPSTIDRQLTLSGRTWKSSWERHVSELFSADMINELEYSLLLEAFEMVRIAPLAADLKERFHGIMGVDTPLSHVDQLRVAISIISAASASYANSLVEAYSPPLRRKDKETAKRLSAAFLLLELLERMKARMIIRGSATSERSRPLKMEFIVRGVYAEELLAKAISSIRDEFKVEVGYTIEKVRKVMPLELQR